MLQKILSLLNRLFGWKYVSHIPNDLKSFVMIGGPHTSNWDFFPAMHVADQMGRNPKFVIKSQWLNPPLGFVFKAMGAVGVNRELIKEGKVASSTDLLANLFKEHKDFVLMISPEGTRSPVDEWKSGFYYIAQKAGVPIVLGFCDYPNKECGLGKVIYPSNYEKDMREIMAFYKTKTGQNPANFKLDKRFS